MLNKRGYSYGAEHPIHFEERLDGWAVFDARDDRDIATGLKQWEAGPLAYRLNGSPAVDTAGIDATP
jgi:hypothetical protein